MHVSGAVDQSESENFTMIRSGDDTSPGSSQFILAQESETHADTIFQPAQLVQQVLDKCSGIARLYAEKLRDNPPSPDKPWRVVLGCDEHTPGSKVVSVNRRKNMALVFNFVELGPDILECDASW